MSSIKRILEETDQGTEIERIDYTDGIKVFLKGHKYPFKGLPSAEAIWATNIVKKLLPFCFLKGIRRIAIYVMNPYILPKEHQTPITRYLSRIIQQKFSKDFAETVAHVFEYDAAYRYRLQSLACETTTDKLKHNPHKELKRLFALAEEREYYDRVQKNIHKLSKLLFLLRFIHVDFTGIEEMHPDEADRYWISLKTDLWRTRK